MRWARVVARPHAHRVLGARGGEGSPSAGARRGERRARPAVSAARLACVRSCATRGLFMARVAPEASRRDGTGSGGVAAARVPSE